MGRNAIILMISVICILGYATYQLFKPAPKIWTGQEWVSTIQVCSGDLYNTSYTVEETCKVVKVIDKDVVYVSYSSGDTCIANEECFLFNARRIY